MFNPPRTTPHTLGPSTDFIPSPMKPFDSLYGTSHIVHISRRFANLVPCVRVWVPSTIAAAARLRPTRNTLSARSSMCILS
ncbi:hypothetical protein C8Q79DRAFT_971790 [Trametes meyenii]|nr:hypothetical protein C8Q79DRAFT_971790 [Trametes meyenii]